MDGIINWGTFLGWTDFASRELMLFAAIWFLIGAVDDVAIDLCWLWHRRGIRGSSQRSAIHRGDLGVRTRRFAIFIPAWQEADVIGHMVAHCLNRWRSDEFILFIGTYANDPGTAQAARAAVGDDKRVQIVVNQRPGPTSKADCLNRLWVAMRDTEGLSGRRFDAVVLHDAEDIVHPAALDIFATRIGPYDFVQLPVTPLPDPHSPWIAGHYCDEFAESHGKAMIVRDRIGAGLPAAGVGCAFSTEILEALAASQDNGVPFAADSVTEDYELGLRITQMGGRGCFVRERAIDGSWIATQAYFPARLGAAVRQKARWMVGIGLSGWDRLGWQGNASEYWMRLRDRRAVLAALVLTAAYLAMLLGTATALGVVLGLYRAPPLAPVLTLLLLVNLVFLIWRLGMRFTFTANCYGWRQGLLALPRFLVGNIISVMAARRALAIYAASLFGRDIVWDKTDHKIPHFETTSVAADLPASFKISHLAGPST